MNGKLYHLNGLNGATGAPLLPPLGARDIVDWIEGASRRVEAADRLALRILWEKEKDFSRGVLGVSHGVDPLDLEQARWAVVYPPDTPPEVRRALADLVAWRQGTELDYRAGESARAFRARHGQGPGEVNPEKLPYYLLLVGSPEAISFKVQYGLDGQHAVGRLCFDETADYRGYVDRLIAYEQASGTLRRERAVAFFAPRHPEDEATESSWSELARPLADAVEGKPLRTPEQGTVTWAVHRHLAADATRSAALDLLTRTEHRPSLLFTATHGLGFPSGHERQRRSQGALVCQDWPGPVAWPENKPIPDDICLSGADVPAEADLGGLVVFAFACYSAGTPRLEDFPHLQPKPPLEIAPAPFVSRLPQRLLAQGALAFLGHVERAWDYSFLALQGGRQIDTFQSTLEAILSGVRLGHAFEAINQRYLDLAREVTDGEEDGLLHQYRLGEPTDPDELAQLWMAHNDARAYVLYGDPAARLRPAALLPG